MQRMHLYSVFSWECCGSSKTTACGYSGKGKKRITGACEALVQNRDWWRRRCRQWDDNGRRAVNFGSSNFFSSGRAKVCSSIPVRWSFLFFYPQVKRKTYSPHVFHIWKSYLGHLSCHDYLNYPLGRVTVAWRIWEIWGAIKLLLLRIPTTCCWIHVIIHVVCVLT